LVKRLSNGQYILGKFFRVQKLADLVGLKERGWNSLRHPPGFRRQPDLRLKGRGKLCLGHISLETQSSSNLKLYREDILGSSWRPAELLPE
jgi:hypothetical protein